MPLRAPRVCQCGRVVPHNQRCSCQRARDQERKARFDATRPSARARGYDSRWEKESKAFLRLNPHCHYCGRPATIVHHVMAHKGDPALFWDRSNWKPACKPCHDGPLQSVERGVVANFGAKGRTGGPRLAREIFDPEPERDF